MSPIIYFRYAVIMSICDILVCQQVIPLTQEQKQDFVEEHNRARSKEAAVNMYEMVRLESKECRHCNVAVETESLVYGFQHCFGEVWDETLANLAGQWAARCEGRHSPTEFRLNVGGFDYVGENLFFDGNQTHAPAARRSMNFWYNEKFLYKWTTGHCKPDTDCLHYTQVVWWDSCALGCAIVKCESLTLVPGIPAGHLVNCIYGPGGNIPDEKPYKKGSQCSGCKNKCHNGLCRDRCPITYDETI